MLSTMSSCCMCGDVVPRCRPCNVFAAVFFFKTHPATSFDFFFSPLYWVQTHFGDVQRMEPILGVQDVSFDVRTAVTVELLRVCGVAPHAWNSRLVCVSCVAASTSALQVDVRSVPRLWR